MCAYNNMDPYADNQTCHAFKKNLKSQLVSIKCNTYRKEKLRAQLHFDL